MLTDQERAVLEVEGQFWKHVATKEAHVRATLDLTPVRYHQIVNRLLNDPRAHALAPQVVTRLRRIRGARR